MEEFYLDNKESGNLNIHLVLSSWSGQRQQCEAKENEETIVVWFSFLYFEASQQEKNVKQSRLRCHLYYKTPLAENFNTIIPIMVGKLLLYHVLSLRLSTKACESDNNYHNNDRTMKATR